MSVLKVYESLKELGLCGSGYDFSVSYLGKAPSYFSVLKARKLEPSIEALATLQYALSDDLRTLDDASPATVGARKRLVELASAIAEYEQKRCRIHLADNGFRYGSRS